MTDLAFASIKELRTLLAKRALSADELLAFTQARFAHYDTTLKSALEIFDSPSITAASNTSGPLGGIPGLIKDTICQKDRITACASKILGTYRAPYDATAVARLKDAGALLIGRANCDEFAMGGSGETSAYQVTKNPWSLSRVPGGSSSGSIAAVAAGFVPWALGSETGGSTRVPAAFCGIVGCKPTYGRISRRGLVAYGSSLDQIGIATRTVYDNALVLQTTAGHDTGDATSARVPVPDYITQLTGKIRPGLKIGMVKNALEAPGIDPEVSQALDTALKQFETLGAQLVPITLPTMDYGAAVYFVLSRAEAASNLARFDGVRYGFHDENAKSLYDLYALSRGHGFGAEIKRRIILGNYVLSAGHADQYYQTAVKVRAMIREEFVQAFTSVDMLFMPVGAGPAYPLNAFATDPLQMDLLDYFVIPANLARVPALALPCGFTRAGLPIGFQLVGPDFGEAQLFAAAHAYEQSTPWHALYPTIPFKE